VGRGGGACALCRPVKSRHRGRAHRDNPVQWCAHCQTPVCGRHVDWVNDEWVCARCQRQGVDRAG